MRIWTHLKVSLFRQVISRKSCSERHTMNIFIPWLFMHLCVYYVHFVFLFPNCYNIASLCQKCMNREREELRRHRTAVARNKARGSIQYRGVSRRPVMSRRACLPSNIIRAARQTAQHARVNIARTLSCYSWFIRRISTDWLEEVWSQGFWTIFLMTNTMESY